MGDLVTNSLTNMANVLAQSKQFVEPQFQKWHTFNEVLHEHETVSDQDFLEQHEQNQEPKTNSSNDDGIFYINSFIFYPLWPEIVYRI